MNIETGREFEFVNPQDDPHLYPRPPAGFGYDIGGRLQAHARQPAAAFRYQYGDQLRPIVAAKEPAEKVPDPLNQKTRGFLFSFHGNSKLPVKENPVGEPVGLAIKNIYSPPEPADSDDDYEYEYLKPKKLKPKKASAPRKSIFKRRRLPTTAMADCHGCTCGHHYMIPKKALIGKTKATGFFS